MTHPARSTLETSEQLKQLKAKRCGGLDDYIETYSVQVGSCCDDFREDELAALVTSINIDEII